MSMLLIREINVYIICINIIDYHDMNYNINSNLAYNLKRHSYCVNIIKMI